MKRKLLCAVLLGLVLLTGCKKDSSDIDTVSSVKTEDTVLISVLEKYPEVDFESEEEIEALYVSDCATEWKEDFDTSDYENYAKNHEEFCEKMDDFLEAEEDAGRIDDYEKNAYCYVVEFASGEKMMYTVPTPEDFLAGDDDGIDTIVTVWPSWGDRVARQASGAKDAAAYVEDSYDVGAVVSFEYTETEEMNILVNPWLGFEKNDLVIVEGHGYYTSNDGSLICIGESVSKQDFEDYWRWTGLSSDEFLNCFIRSNQTEKWGKIYYDIYISRKFFERYYSPGDLEGTVFYLGTCCSLMDDQLASTLCSLGAEVVIGWDALAYSYYEKEVCQNLFKLLAEGESVTTAIDQIKTELYHKYYETVHVYLKDIQKNKLEKQGIKFGWGDPCCYPVGSTFTLDDLYGAEETTEPKEEQPAVQEPETLSPEDLANIDYSQMKETYLGDITIIYDDSYNESVSVGKVPDYSIYLGELADVFPDYPNLSSADMGNYDAHPEFMQDGVIVPLVHFRSDRYITEVTEGNQFLFDNATQQQYDEFFGLHSWGLLPNMPEAFREPLEEIMNWAIGEYWIEKEELIGLAMKGTEDYEYIDEKGREVFGFDMGNSTYYDGQRIIETDEYNLHACISIGFDYTYPYNEHPHNEDIYFSIETENGIQHYKMEMVGLSTTQTSELNRIAYEENRFAKALEYWHVFNNYFGMEVELYQLTE